MKEPQLHLLRIRLEMKCRLRKWLHAKILKIYCKWNLWIQTKKPDAGWSLELGENIYKPDTNLIQEKGFGCIDTSHI